MLIALVATLFAGTPSAVAPASTPVGTGVGTPVGTGVGTPAAGSSLATYTAAVKASTSAVRAALPRVAACQLPVAERLVLRVDLEHGGAVSTNTSGPLGSATIALPCVERVVAEVFKQAPPPVGREAVIVFGTRPGLAMEGDVALFGHLEHDAVEEGVRAGMDRLAQCYIAALGLTPGLGGNLDVRFVVLPDGSVTSAAIDRTTLFDPTVESCVLRELVTLRFAPPETGGIVRVSYPFAFNPP